MSVNVHFTHPSAASRAAVPPRPNTANTPPPASTGVGVANEFLPSLRVGSWVNTSRSQSSLPVSAANARTWHRLPSPVVPVTTTRPSATTGEDQPAAGTSAVHLMFLPSPHSV